MPYSLLQGGRRRRRSRRPLAALALALAVTAALLGLWPAGGGRRPARGRDAGPGPQPAQAAAARSPIRLAGGADRVRLRFRHPPRAALLFNLDSGEVLWRRAPTRAVPIASLTKLMTALLVVEHAPPSATVKITRAALAYEGSGVGVLPRGRRVSLETLLAGLLLPSGNDAAIALAQRIAGTVPRFVAMMNAKARALGLSCAHFSSPHGFADAGNHACAADLAALTVAVLREPRLAAIVRRRREVRRFPIRGGKLYLYNNNPLVRAGYPGVTGVKTGYTDAAGRCLVASARRGGVRLAVVLLHSPDPAAQARRLLDRGFALARG